MQMKRLPIILFALAIFEGCSPPTSRQNDGIPALYETDQFKSYWYAGKAELSSFELTQSRYGENHKGKAMLIFVTEDFSKKKQVKLDDPSRAGNDKTSVLKLNFTKNFVTGIYPYSMMLSVFSPVSRNQQPHSLKVTMSSQEWCGNVFSQINLVRNKYTYVGHSYFETEGDEIISLQNVLLEDELWNIIRLDPENLPTGEVKIIPGFFFSRLRHTHLKVLRSTISNNEHDGEMTCTVNLPEQERTLVIRYQKKFPHKILGWAESFTERGKKLQTTAVLDKTIIVDYWTKNKNEFQYLRDSLGLSPNNF